MPVDEEPEAPGTALVRAQLAALTVAAVGDAVVTLDAKGVVTSWNPRAEVLLGRPGSEMVGATLAAVIPEEFRARHMAGFHAAIQSGALAHEGRPAHVQATTADGDVLALAMTLGLLRQADGLIVGAVAVLRPIGDLELFA